MRDGYFSVRILGRSSLRNGMGRWKRKGANYAEEILIEDRRWVVRLPATNASAQENNKDS